MATATTTATTTVAASPARVYTATCAAPTNIATIKYWGKADTRLNTPLNSSVSVTLDQADLRTVTTAAASPAFAATDLWLNGRPHKLNARVEAVLREIQALAARQFPAGERATKDVPDPTWHLRIVSENSFPTAAGLASSAAGYACLVATLAELYGVHEEFPGQLSTIARQGSGSACRSMYGGFVRWQRGPPTEDESDLAAAAIAARGSRAVQIADEAHWPELCAIICVVHDREKDTSSTSGMTTSRATSTLLAHRADNIVDGRLATIEAAYRARDFATFARVTMEDSNQFHAVCLDTFPPIFYLNEVSRKLIHLVHRYNAARGATRLAYTFDAGPNAVLFLETRDVPEVVALLRHYFPRSAAATGTPLPIHSKTMPSLLSSSSSPVPQDLKDAVQLAPTVDGLKMLYVTRVGGGPRVLPVNEALVDPATGEPRLQSHASKTSMTSNAKTHVMAPRALALALAATVLVSTTLRGLARRAT